MRVGITDYAQDALGDIVYVELPEVQSEATKGSSVSEVESTKSVSDIYAPLSGKVVEINEGLNEAPEVINTDPYDKGWIFVIEVADTLDMSSLLDAAGYQSLTEV